MIYTFYSFKGGVGRSMALANIGWLLAERGLRVLLIDMDLEAPGLERFFEDDRYPVDPRYVSQQRGIIDMLISYKEVRLLMGTGPTASDAELLPLSAEPLRSFVITLADVEGGQLMMIPAGSRLPGAYAEYAERVGAFDWDDFYVRWEGERFFDWFRDEALTLADVVLIDSRTGITELGGICTSHLADAVVLCIAPNAQNLDGCELIARNLADPGRQRRFRGSRPLGLLPVPSRIDHSESDQLQLFQAEFNARMHVYVSPELGFESSLFIDLKVPYVPAYAYREAIAAAEPERAVASEMIAAYRRLTATMIQMAPADSQIQRRLQAPSAEPTGVGVPPRDLVPREWVTTQTTTLLSSPGTPVVLIGGPPGSGKTTVVQWWSENPKLLHHELLLVHSCAHHQEQDARSFIETLARQLGKHLPDYASTVRYQRNPQIAVGVKANISALGDTTSFIDDVSLGEVPVTTAYDELICKAVPERKGEPSLLVLIDALDAVLVAITRLPG